MLTITEIKSGASARLSDVTCTFGRHDKPYPEQHASAAWAIAVVRRGSFSYRNNATSGRHALRPGWLLVGRPGATFECSHDHDHGDMCASIMLDERMIDDAANAAHVPWSRLLGSSPVLVPDARIAALIERARVHEGSIDEVGCLVAERLVEHASGSPAPGVAHHPSHVRRVEEAVERLETGCAEDLALADLAADAGLSAFHFLRVFRRITGTTPHQYLVGARLRLAAKLLLDTKRPVTAIAYDSGFSDLSNFVRTFHRVVGTSPGRYRRTHSSCGSGRARSARPPTSPSRVLRGRA